MSEEEQTNNCLITDEPLTTGFVELACKHKFNYDALFQALYHTKYVYPYHYYYNLPLEKRTMIANVIKENELNPFDINQIYYIECPYCRHIQMDLLPYEPEIEPRKIYGINSIDLNDNPIYAEEEERRQRMYCNAIFKSGQNKGKRCCARTIKDGKCGRHLTKQEKEA